MLKYAALLFNTVALLIYQFFFAEGITITQNLPANVKAGEEFTVELVINKGNVSGFAKLQQDLPEGFTAVQQDNNGASFTFSNQSVKFIWMSLPSETEFKIKYKVKVAAGVSGDKTIAGKFSYVSDNVKQSVDISPGTVKVGSDAASQPIATNNTPANTGTTNTENSSSQATTPVNTTPDPVTTTTDPVATNTTSNTSSSAEVSSVKAVRTIPATATTDFKVEIVINKGTVTGFAKLLETLPAGFSATAIESAGGSFSFSDQKVKFVWVSMPTQPEFKISYKVSVAPGTSGFQVIDGVFSYIENDETKKSSLATSTVNIGGTAPLANNTTENKSTEPVNNTANNTTNTNTNNNTNSTANTANNSNSSSLANNSGNSSNKSSNNTSTDNSAKSIAATTIPAPQGNVMYKVQVAALRNSIDANKIAAMYNLNQKINTEMAEGFTKYTVGAHNEYRAARDAREEIKNKGVVGPFVTAYNSGKRITVQEALMITSQKWYR
jgi:hypothetical protein